MMAILFWKHDLQIKDQKAILRKFKNMQLMYFSEIIKKKEDILKKSLSKKRSGIIFFVNTHTFRLIEIRK